MDKSYIYDGDYNCTVVTSSELCIDYTNVVYIDDYLFIKERKLSRRHWEVLDWIEEFLEVDKEVFEELDYEGFQFEKEHRRIYQTGNCFFFAEQLVNAFPEGQIWISHYYGHAIVEIDGIFFDSNGIVINADEEIFEYEDDEDSWEEMPIDREATDLDLLLMSAWSHKNGEPCGELYPQAALTILEQKRKYFDDVFEILDDEFEVDELINRIHFVVSQATKIISRDKYHDLIERNGWNELFQRTII